MTLTDQSLMPFGTHKDVPMEKVPAEYLLWLWDDAGLWNRDSVKFEGFPHDRKHAETRLAVHDYIKNSLSALETECPDRIIKHRP